MAKKVEPNKEEVLARVLKSNSLYGIPKEQIIQNFESMCTLLARIDCSVSEKHAIICNRMNILSHDPKELNRNLDDMFAFGYEKPEIKTMLKKNVKALTRTKEEFENSQKIFESIGVTKEEFKRIPMYNLKALDFTLEMLNERVKEMASIGFNESEFKDALVRESLILTIPIQSINDHIDALVSPDFTREDIKHMIILSPILLKREVYKVREILNTASLLGIKDEYVKNPNRIRVSVKLLKARAHYISGRGISPRSRLGIHYLFSTSTKFKNVFGVDNKDVENIYDLAIELASKRKKLEKQD